MYGRQGVGCVRYHSHLLFNLPIHPHSITYMCVLSFPGYRIGKGEGFADMEYGMMVSMGAVDESTVVVTVVHDCQVSPVIVIVKFPLYYYTNINANILNLKLSPF